MALEVALDFGLDFYYEIVLCLDLLGLFFI